MNDLHFIDRLQLAFHPEIFIPENCASLPDWDIYKGKSSIDKTGDQLDLFFKRMSAASGIPAGMLKGES